MTRTGVFISYSRKDEEWLDKLSTHLNYLEREFNFTIWDDSKIEVGSEWRKQIKKAIDSAKVAILLVSANFIASEFIIDEELPPLLAAAKKEGAVILPIIISHCLFEDIDSLSKFQTVNAPSEPLKEMTESEQDELFVKVTKEIKEILSTNTINGNKDATKNAVMAKNTYEIAFARVCTMRVFFEDRSIYGLTTTDVYKKTKLSKRKEVVQAIRELEELGYLMKTKKDNKTYLKLTSSGQQFIKEYAKSIVFK